MAAFAADFWSANTFMALQGVQTTDWLRAEGNRPFKNLKDILTSYFDIRELAGQADRRP